MSERDQPAATARTRALRQLALAATGTSVMLVHPTAGFAALSVLCLVWPPMVPLLPVRAGAVLRAYLPWVAVWLLFALAYLRAMAALGSPVEPQSSLRELVGNGVAAAGFWPSVVVVVVLAPVLEEFVFRGYLFTALRQVAPRALAHLVTAALFGLAHGLGHALPIAFLSLLFGHLRERHGALLPAMLAHALHNGLTVAVFVCWPELLDLFYAG